MRKFINWLYRYFVAKDLEKLKKLRLQQLRDFIYIDGVEFIPVLRNKLIMENLNLNIFKLPDESFPRFDIFIPDLQLFIILEDPSWDNFEISTSWGYTQKEWATSQDTKSAYSKYFDPLGSQKTFNFISIPWKEPVPQYLYQSLKRILA